MERTADDAWLKRVGLDQPSNFELRFRSLEIAELIQFQSIDELSSFYPTEIIATAKDFQPEMRFGPQDVIPVEPVKGRLLVLGERL